MFTIDYVTLRNTSHVMYSTCMSVIICLHIVYREPIKCNIMPYPAIK